MWICFGDEAFFPRMCPPLEEDLITCVGSTFKIQLSAIDPENDPVKCDGTSSATRPEKCYFDLLDKGNSPISITPNGEITYEPTVAESKTFKFMVYDKNVIDYTRNIE